MRRLLLALLFLVPAGSAFAQSSDAFVDVVVVSDPMDERTVDFVTRAITDTDASLVVLQLNVAVVLGGDVDGLRALIADPPVPVAVWVGPTPATARCRSPSGDGGAFARSGSRFDHRPGVALLAGGSASEEPVPLELLDELVPISEPIPGVIDLVEPSIGQFIVGLHGRSLLVDGSEVTLDTARSEVVDGVERLVPSKRVRFVSEGLIDRVLHAAVRPEAAFFFLLAGLTLAVFEFYASGPGLAAAVAVVCLFLAGHGLSVMPTWWPGVVASLGESCCT